MTKKKNHEVSKLYLKRWAKDGKIWLFDIETQKIEDRSTKATFAIDDYLYVPEINGKRDDTVEDWFGEAENELALYLQRLDRRDFSTPMTIKHYTQIVYALVGLGYRSGHELRLIEERLQTDPDLRDQMGVTDDSNTHLIAVENLINVVTRQAEQYLQMGISVIYGTEYPLITCERPGFDGAAKGENSFHIPLGPNELAMFDGRFQIGSINHTENRCTENFIAMANHMTIERARKWVVANGREELEKIAHMLSKDKVDKRKAKDRLIFTPLSEEERAQGWSLYKGVENQEE